MRAIPMSALSCPTSCPGGAAGVHFGAHHARLATPSGRIFATIALHHARLERAVEACRLNRQYALALHAFEGT